ncbi:hypothetical protein CC1G_02993 [Coprinopsis cinerea okayama7|uniref:Uncharacterized protein n=1 Tax=Coprinopsis cinerea (strain Okayama-7 / 130 / ATCC MYA-4618 / FGSC 9003) TaxID=240176 RepID=A8NS07_COPC7|nr:hypothetical protein CC1G_02993 [Coprinopsis cinerea okayama7\|eukprot:XP_001835905.2 hypothetical protein CC1G_02993 [Coprinopsis cinerea okayama7\
MLRLALCVLLFSGTQVVLSLARLQFNFSEVQQCQPFTFSLNGQLPTEAPVATSLSIIPFGSNPVVIPIPNAQAISGGLFSSFVPFPAGTRFVAALEDGQGATMIRVSDVMEVQPSQVANSDRCLDPDPSPTRHFTVEESPSQCGQLALAYNVTSIPQAPRVRVYSPLGFSFFLNQTSDDPSTGTATYLMSVSRGKQVVLLVDGGNGIRETSALLTVVGNSSSPQECLGEEDRVEATMDNNATATNVPTKAIIIGSAAGGGAVVLIAVAMCTFILCERKKKRKVRKARDDSFDGTRMHRSMDEKAPMPPPTFVISPAPAMTSAKTAEGLTVPTRNVGNRTDSLSSWIQVTPLDQRVPMSQVGKNFRHTSLAPSLAMSESRNVMPHPVDERERLSINSLDIEGMLNMASMQSESAARKSSVSTLPFGPDLSSASPPKTRALTDIDIAAPRRTLKVNSDIPDDLHSAYSRDSVNPFSTVYDPSSPASAVSPTGPRSPPEEPTAVSKTSGNGLPSSPRDGRAAPGRSSIAGSDRSSSDWYGVGIAR